MLPQSKGALAFLVALPLLLIIPLWRAAHRRPHLWGVLTTPTTALALSGDGSAVALVQGNGRISIWPYAGKRLLLDKEASATNANPSIYSPVDMRFSADDASLLVSNIRRGDSSTSLYSWDTRNGKINWSALSDSQYDKCRYWPSPDGKYVAQRSSNEVQILNIAGGGTAKDSKDSQFARDFPVLTRFDARVPEPKGGKSLIRTLALSPDAKTVVGATQNGQLVFWAVATGNLQSQTKPTSAIPTADWEMQYSPDGRFVALFDGTTISVWDTVVGDWSTTTAGSTSSEVALAWMPNSQSLWTGSGTIQQWSVPKLERLKDLPVGGPVAVSGDGRTLVTRALAGSGIPAGIWAWDIG